MAWIDPVHGQYAPPKPVNLYDNIITTPLKYTGNYVNFKGKDYPEIFLPPDEYASKFFDINTYVVQNELDKYRDKLKRYYPEYNLEVVVKNGVPGIINLER